MKHYRGYQRCSRIDYACPDNVFELTMCSDSRTRLFVNEPVNSILVGEIQQLNEECMWTVFVYCIMPDHVHFMVAPGIKGLSVAVRLFKGRTTAKVRSVEPIGLKWQRSYFDHRIRSSDSFSEKSEYILQNPVRAGLCRVAEEYPWTGVLAVR